jgi:S-adenosylmethionine synthetase
MSFARLLGPGHPDQACDLVAATIVEEYLRRDPASRLNIRVSGGRGVLFAVGEVLSNADFDVSATVRKALGQSGVQAHVDPFIAFEPLAPALAPEIGSRTWTQAFAYATDETPAFLPKPVALARRVAQELERRRREDGDWFWLGSDFEVVADTREATPTVELRLEHVETQTVEQVRAAVQRAFAEGGMTLRVNPAGAEKATGLNGRIGSSGKVASLEQFGAFLPAPASGVGLHALHPLNVGTWLLRQAARELVVAKKAKAIMAHAAWAPHETTPSFLRFRSERGDDLSAEFAPGRFDLAHVPDAFRDPRLVVDVLRAGFDGLISLPWET